MKQCSRAFQRSLLAMVTLTATTILVIGSSGVIAQGAASTSKAHFDTDVAPVFNKYCTACHTGAQTQGKIERWHQTLKNRVLQENYFFPGDLEQQIEAFIEHYNHRRYHEILENVTPADAYFGRATAIIQRRERIKRQTIEYRRLQHRKHAA